MRARRSGIAALAGIFLLVVSSGCGDEVAHEDQQGTIQGQVTLEEADDYSGVEVSAGGESTITEEDGEYILNWISAGEVEVTASHDDYLEETKTVEVDPRETTTADFELQLAHRPPVIEEVHVEPTVLLPEQTAEVTVEAHDPDEGPLQYSWEATEGFEIHGADDAPEAELIAPDELGVQAQLTVTVEDDQGATDEETVDIETRTNQDPVIESISATPDQFEPGEIGALEVEASDPDGDELAYQWNAPDGWTIDPDDEPQVDVTAPEAPEQSATIEVVVTDGLGGQATEGVDVSTRDNQPPEIMELTVDPPQVEPGGEIALSVDAEDPDGDDIEYAWSAPSDWTLTADSQPETTVIAPDEYENTAEIGIEVTDEHGAVASADVVVSTITALGPQIEEVSADPTQVFRGDIVELLVVATHPEDAELTYEWFAPSGWDLIEDDDAPAEPELIAPDEPGVNATIEVTVTDPEGNEAVGSVLVSTLANNKPVIESLDADPASVVPGETTSISANAYDPDGESLSYDWSIPSDWSGSSTDDELQLTAPDDYDQTGTVTLQVDDGWDTTTASVSVSTVPNVDPTISSFDADPSVVERGGTSQLSVDASDPYGEPLSYDWSIDNADWTLDASDDSADLIASDTPDDEVEVTVVVDDGHGGSAEATQTVQTAENSPPIIDDFTASDAIVERQGTTDLTVDAQDPNGGSLTYDWSIDNADWTLDASEDTAELTAPDVSESVVEVTVVVEDDVGDTAEATETVQTEQNFPPSITNIGASPQIVERDGNSTITIEAEDPNGEPLSYDWSIDNDDWSLSGSGDQITAEAPDIPDNEATVSVDVDDGYGGVSSAQLTVQTESTDPPQIIDLTSDLDEWIERGGIVELTVDATAPEDDPLSYDWSAPSGWDIVGDDDDDQIELEAPDESNAQAVVEVTVEDPWGGDATDTIDVRTQNTEPEPFGFDDKDDVLIYSTFESNEVTVEGFDAPLAASCDGCEVSRNGGDFDESVDGFEPGDTIQIRTDSSPEYDTTTTASVTLGDTESATWSVTTRPSDLIARWELDDGSGDIATDSINGNDGEIRGADWVTDSERGTVLEFDGNSDDVVVWDLVDAPSGSITAITWFRTDSQDGSEQLIGKHDGGSDGDWYISVRSSGSRSHTITDENGRVNCYNSSEFDSAYHNDEWHMSALVYDTEDEEIRLYWNGEFDSSCPQHGELQDDPDPVSFGSIVRDSDDPYWHFEGRLDDIYYFDRALPEEEIEALWNR